MKNVKIKRIIGIFLILSSLAFAIDISNCATLNTEGATYTLTANATATGSSDCFTFSGNNIQLDCNGHFATTNLGSGAVINGQSNSTIKNCNFNSTVNGQDISIAINATSNCDVNITNTTGTLGYPIAFYNASVNLADTTYSDLLICGGNNTNLTRINVFSLNETVTDIAPNNVFIYFSKNVTFDTVNFTGAKGIYFLNSSGVVVKNSWLFGVDMPHLNLDPNSPFTSFFNNTLHGGFEQFAMNNGVIENNSLLFSTELQINPDSFIYCVCSNSTFKNNILDKSGGISLSGNNNTITENNFTDNSQLDVQGYNNTIYNNMMNGSDFSGILGAFSYLHISTSSGGNSIHDNNLTSTRLGIEGDNNLIYNNILNVTYQGNPMWSGIFTSGSGNLFYNNYFGQIHSDFLGTNFWNTTKQAGNRIYSAGTQIGGNYWADSGGGYSETCVDSDTDGFCDNSYVNGSLGTITDYLPLSNKYVAPTPPGGGGGTSVLTCFDNTPLGDCSVQHPGELCTVFGLRNDSSCINNATTQCQGAGCTSQESISETAIEQLINELKVIRTFLGFKYTFLFLLVFVLLMLAVYEFGNNRQVTGSFFLLTAMVISFLALNSINVLAMNGYVFT